MNGTMGALLKSLLLTLCCFAAMAAQGAPDPSSPEDHAKADKPNIIFIFADDLGWGDLACYGHPVLKTPYLDQMAEDGLLVTNFYVANPVCSPSRTAVMTGQYPARHGIHQHFASPEINRSRNMPDFLDPNVTLLTKLMQDHGYKTAHIGKWHLGSTKSAPVSAYGIDVNPTIGGPRHQSTEKMVDAAIEFIQANKDAPFYVNLWTLVPHATLDTTDEQMAPYARRGPMGAAKARGFSSPAQVYYGAVTDMDYHIGRLIRKIDEMGIADNTLVVFSSDNGPEDIHASNATHSGVGSAGPLRGRKRSLYEGGIRVPFIVRWKGHTPAGRVDDQSIVGAVDLLPTFCSLAGIEMPDGYQSDGQDVSKVLLGQSMERDRPLLWDWTGIQMGNGAHVSNMSPGLALRSGKWKFLMNPDGTRKELYDFEADPQCMELDNVADQFPDEVRRFGKMLREFKASIPQGGPREMYREKAGSNAYPMPKLQSGDVPRCLFKNADDYGFMWWEDGVRNTSNYVFKMRTNQYALSFDFPKLQIQELGIVPADEDETKVLRAPEAVCFEGALPTVFAAVIEANGKRYQATGGKVLSQKHSLDNCQLVESGKYYNRRFLNDLVYEADAPALDQLNSGIEIASWPDRLLFLLRSVPTDAVVQGMLEMSLDLDDKFSIELTDGGGHALLAEDGTGYVLLPTPGADLLVDATRAEVTVRSPKQSWPAASENTVGLIVYPVSSDGKMKLSRALDAEKGAPLITAHQLEPSRKPINVEYDPAFGYYNLEVFNEGSGKDRFDRSQIVIRNTAPHERQIRIRFEKERNARATGQVMMLRDEAGNPLGIPVQISKNWHTNRTPHRYAGTWLMGLTMLTVPANSSTTIELVTANAHWGKVPVASTAQLCLVGWGGNQQWNQSAIGDSGENICYDTDQSLKEVSLTDMRAVYSNAGEAWGGNVGGAGFCRYYVDATKLMGRKGMRTHYRRYSPNMTEVTYASRSRDNSIDQEFTAIEYRSDGLTRGIYKMRMDVRSDIDFADFVFFQMGSENYNIGNSDTLAVGNENGLVKEWTATKGGQTYYTPKTEAKGRLPWFSFQDSHDDHSRDLIGANRGFVIRSWEARVNGVDKVPPYWAEFGTDDIRWTKDTSIINIVPPPDVKGFQAGDFVEAEIEVIVIPRREEEYFGPNGNLRKALAADANTWKMVQREVLGNDLAVEMVNGILQRMYPIQIKVAGGDAAQFRVTGGIGYVPFTFTGVNGYRDPLLEENVNGTWKKIDQSNHGKDFWQADYSQGSWDITFNVNLDGPEDARVAREFRFTINNGPS